jgi:hypothetical protein
MWGVRVTPTVPAVVMKFPYPKKYIPFKVASINKRFLAKYARPSEPKTGNGAKTDPEAVDVVV